MGARNRVGIGVLYRSARLHSLAELILGLHKSFKIRALMVKQAPLGRERKQIRARISKRLRIPGIDSKESIPPDWKSIPGLLKKVYIYGSGQLLLTTI
jgi:hypothetical protein